MERKLIGAVNVNTWIDARDRKSGLANWLTVSPLYPLLPFFLLFSLSLSLDVFVLPLSLHPPRAIVLCRSFFHLFSFLVPPGSFEGSTLSQRCQFTDSPGIERSILHLAASLDFWFEWLQSGGIRLSCTACESPAELTESPCRRITRHRALSAGYLSWRSSQTLEKCVFFCPLSWFSWFFWLSRFLAFFFFFVSVGILEYF